MKLFFISDIHGSYYFLQKALDCFASERADYLVILGDELYHGARNPLPEGYDTKKTAALLNEHADHIIAVRGNCDSEVDQMVLDFPIMSDYSLILHESRRLFLTHGHIFGPEKLPLLNVGDVFCYGHTHLPVAEKQGEIFIFNPGSITLPKENHPHTYGVFSDFHLSIKTLDGELFKQIDLRK